MEKMIRQSDIENYCVALQGEERSPGTIAKYRRDIMAFSQWVDGLAASKELAANWKGHLLECHYAPRTVNSMLAALNGFFNFMGWEIKVKFLKIQNQIFRDERRELTRAEYSRLITAAQNGGKERLMLIMETLCATGIRISELRYITVPLWIACLSIVFCSFFDLTVVPYAIFMLLFSLGLQLSYTTYDTENKILIRRKCGFKKKCNMTVCDAKPVYQGDFMVGIEVYEGRKKLTKVPVFIEYKNRARLIKTFFGIYG